MRLLVIQEHNADKAGLHWDIRFEHHLGSSDKYDSMRPNTNEPTNSTFKKVLKSFVIPKHRLPEGKERLLTIPTEDHPWEYKDFDGEIKEGYGKGTVKLVHCGEVEVPTFNDEEIIFEFEGESYRISKASWMRNYLIQRNEKTTN